MYENRSHDYLIGNHFEETKKFYLDVRASMQQAGIGTLKQTLFGRQQTKFGKQELRHRKAGLLPKPNANSRIYIKGK